MHLGSLQIRIYGMDDIQHIEREGITYALVFRRNIAVSDEVRFASRNEDPLQVGFFERSKGYASAPHRHLPRNIHLEHPAEFLSIERGKVSIAIYDEAWKTVEECELTMGECILFLHGGHAITILEDARIMEVKQGPFMQQDKVFRPAP